MKWVFYSPNVCHRDKLKLLILALTLVLSGSALASGLNDLADRARHNERDATNTMAIPTKPPTPSPEVEEAIRQMEIFLNSKDPADRLKDAQKIDLFKGLNKAASEEGPAQASSLKGKRIFVFISGSIPRETLREYAIALDRGGDPLATSMVMRGLVAGSGLKGLPTLQFLHKVLSKDNGGVMDVSVTIDPPLFEKFGIQKVPAVVFVPSIQERDSFESATMAKMNNGFYIYYGDAALDYALEQINKHVHDGELEKYIKQLRKGFY